MATSLPQDILVVALCLRGVLDLGLAQDQGAQDMLNAVRSIDCDSDASPTELNMLLVELDAIMLELSSEEPETVHTGATGSTEVGDDVGHREGVVDSLGAIAEAVVGAGNEAPVSDSVLPKADGAADIEMPKLERKSKYPRVDPPEIEDQFLQAIREDCHGYIAKAFPKLIPFGTGDYHGNHCGWGRTLRFEEWGRYLMLWHDGRLMQHTRFR